MLCYGYITLYAPPELAVSRLEANVLNVVVPQLSSVKVCLQNVYMYTVCLSLGFM